MTENQKNADRYLTQIRKIETLISGKELELEALRYKASGAGAIRYDKDHVQTSPQNFMEMAMCDIIEISQSIEEDRASIEDIKANAYAIVRKMQEPTQRAMIEWFYLNGLDMNDVAERMFRSERAAYYLKDDALEEFGKLMVG